MAEGYQERADRRVAEYEKIRREAFRRGYDAAIEKLNEAETRAIGSVKWAAFYHDWLDNIRPPEAK